MDQDYRICVGQGWLTPAEWWRRWHEQQQREHDAYASRGEQR